MLFYFQCAHFKSVFTISCHHHLDAPRIHPRPLFTLFPSSCLPAVHISVCSQELAGLCQTEIRWGCRSPRRPHRGGTGREQSSPVLLPLRQPVRLLGSSRCLVPFSHPRSPHAQSRSLSSSFMLTLFLHHNGPPLSTPQGGPRGHPVIRCPSDVFTLSVTANTSGAHIQVIPVPLDTFHEIISEVVMAIFSP